MAFLLNKASSLSSLRLHSQKSEDSLKLYRRGFHTEMGPRHKKLLADDPVLRRFKSHKKVVQRIKRISDFVTIVVVAGCCYEIFGRATMREEGGR